MLISKKPNARVCMAKIIYKFLIFYYEKETIKKAQFFYS